MKEFIKFLYQLKQLNLNELQNIISATPDYYEKQLMIYTVDNFQIKNKKNETWINNTWEHMILKEQKAIDGFVELFKKYININDSVSIQKCLLVNELTFQLNYNWIKDIKSKLDQETHETFLVNFVIAQDSSNLFYYLLIIVGIIGIKILWELFFIWNNKDILYTMEKKYGIV